jgi:hypothetical protein
VKVSFTILKIQMCEKRKSNWSNRDSNSYIFFTLLLFNFTKFSKKGFSFLSGSKGGRFSNFGLSYFSLS